jgi:sugar/nucleoside kinase (ribokinase family)
LPAYHATGDSTRAEKSGGKVVDPTGGGNGFLGGFAVGLTRNGGDLVEAAIWGSIAASYCIEQVGMPELSYDADKGERWNGTDVKSRLDAFRQRISK